MVEGNTVNGIERLTGASKHTILRLLELAGTACMAHHDRAVRGVKASRVECDEIWSFNYCKRANLAKAKAAPADAGDVWTWTAIDADSKLLVSYLLGGRDADAAQDLMHDVADRLANRVQLGLYALLSFVIFGIGQLRGPMLVPWLASPVGWKGAALSGLEGGILGVVIVTILAWVIYKITARRSQP